MPFSSQEKATLRQALNAGQLSDEQLREIIRQNEEGPAGRPASEPLTRPGPAPAADLNPDLGMTPEQMGRGQSVMAGSLIGGAVGFASPIPGGAVLGAGLGAAAGSITFDTMQDVLRFVGQGHVPEPPGTIQRFKTAAYEARLELMFAAGGPALMAASRFTFPTLGSILGVNAARSQRLRALADEAGFTAQEPLNVTERAVGKTPNVARPPLGAADVGNRFARGMRNVIGVFPWISAPGKKLQAVQRATTDRIARGILDAFAPDAILRNELGVDMFRVAQETSAGFRKVSGLLFERFRKLADNASVKELVPTENTVDQIGQLIAEVDAGRVVLKSGKVLEGGTDALEQYLRDALDLPDLISVKAWRGIRQRISKFVADAQPLGSDLRVVGLVKEGMGKDLNAIRVDLLPPGEAALLRESLETSNRFYSEGIFLFKGVKVKKIAGIDIEQFKGGIDIFETPTAKKFKRAGAFKRGPKPKGSIDIDEVVAPVFNTKSPIALKEVRRLVGDKVFRRASRNWFQEVLAKSVKTVQDGSISKEIFDPVRFSKELGLGVSQTKMTAGALDEILKGTGVTRKKLSAFAELLNEIPEIRDASSFVVRRVTLGGPGALIGAALIGSAATDPKSGAAGLVTTVALTLLVRRGATILSSPNKLALLRRGFDRGITVQKRRQALSLLLSAVAKKDKRGEEPSKALPEKQLFLGGA